MNTRYSKLLLAFLLFTMVGCGKDVTTYHPNGLKESEGNLRDNETVHMGAIVQFENAVRDGLFLDYDGGKGTLMPLQKYNGSTGCDWILHDVGGGYYAVQNRSCGKFLGVKGVEKYYDVELNKRYRQDGNACDWKIVYLGKGRYKLVSRKLSSKNKEYVLDINGSTNMPMIAIYKPNVGCDWVIRRKAPAQVRKVSIKADGGGRLQVKALEIFIGEDDFPGPSIYDCEVNAFHMSSAQDITIVTRGLKIKILGKNTKVPYGTSRAQYLLK